MVQSSSSHSSSRLLFPREWKMEGSEPCGTDKSLIKVRSQGLLLERHQQEWWPFHKNVKHQQDRTKHQLICKFKHSINFMKLYLKEEKNLSTSLYLFWVLNPNVFYFSIHYSGEQNGQTILNKIYDGGKTWIISINPQYKAYFVSLRDVWVWLKGREV